MRTIYLDLISGLSGDMFLGAMIDLGVSLPHLSHELEKLKLDGYHLHADRQCKSAIEGVKFDVHCGDHHHEHHHHHDEDEGGHHHHHHHHGDHDEEEHHHDHAHHEKDHHHHHHDHDHAHSHDHHGHDEHEHEHGRDFKEITKLIQTSGLSPWVKEKALAVFGRVARAEAKIHGKTIDTIHFHEVGGVDSIVDIVGACIALEALGKPRLLASQPVDGTGWIQCAHGRFPIPAPATLQIFAERGVAITQCEEPHELITPTGAALLAEFAASFGPMRDLRPERIGYGLGTRNLKSRPNLVRAILGDSASTALENDWETDTIGVLETNLDDLNPELLGYFVDHAFSGGALDVFHTPVHMKKNRPGVLLTVLCALNDMDRLTELILRETSALGVRRSTTERRKLRRESKTVKTAYGDIVVKIGRLNGQIVQVAPEFESCKKAAAESQVPLKHIYEAAIQAAAD